MGRFNAHFALLELKLFNEGSNFYFHPRTMFVLNPNYYTPTLINAHTLLSSETCKQGEVMISYQFEIKRIEFVTHVSRVFFLPWSNIMGMDLDTS